jgi:hypothetical protein
VSVALEIKAGPLAGKTISLAGGESVLVGRAAERVQFAAPHDDLMSGVHFAMEYGPDGCRVIDKKSTNGTYLNGAKIREAMLLANGDEIKSDQTVFVVRIVPDAHAPTPAAGPRAPAPDSAAIPRQPQALAVKPPSSSPASAPGATRSATAPPDSGPHPSQSSASSVPPLRPSVPSALVIGGWAFHKIPEGWHIQEGIGIQQVVKDAFPASIAAMEEPLGPGITLPKYVDEQSKMFRENVYQPKIGTAATPAVSGSIIGVLTLTALEKDLASVRPIYDSALVGISFSSAK